MTCSGVGTLVNDCCCRKYFSRSSYVCYVIFTDEKDAFETDSDVGAIFCLFICKRVKVKKLCKLRRYGYPQATVVVEYKTYIFTNVTKIK